MAKLSTVEHTSGQPLSVLPWSAMKSPVNILALGFGSGYFPKAPGTAGSVLALLLALAFPVLINLWIVFVASLSGVYICQYCADKLGVHDHGGIVWDEFCGVWLTLALIPQTPAWWLAGFACFRFFDIVKPWPIKWIDSKVEGGWGIMLDDLLAAIFAALVVNLIALLLELGMGNGL